MGIDKFSPDNIDELKTELLRYILNLPIGNWKFGYPNNTFSEWYYTVHKEQNIYIKHINHVCLYVNGLSVIYDDRASIDSFYDFVSKFEEHNQSLYERNFLNVCKKILK